MQFLICEIEILMSTSLVSFEVKCHNISENRKLYFGLKHFTGFRKGGLNVAHKRSFILSNNIVMDMLEREIIAYIN